MAASKMFGYGWRIGTVIMFATAYTTTTSAQTTGPQLEALREELTKSLQEIANDKVKKYNCGFAIGMHGPGGFSTSVAAGTDIPSGTVPITPMSKFIWGSVTKMVTGVNIIRDHNAGKFSVDDKVFTILDPYFKSKSFKTMEQLFGPVANNVSIRNLATMTSGIPDFDTAKPDNKDPSKSTDPFRKEVYDTPARDWGPFDLLSVPWVAKGSMDFAPGNQTSYSSTNFVLLGLVLAATRGVEWDKFDQGAWRPQTSIANGLLNNTKWGVTGVAPNTFTNVHGFDQTSYNGHNSSAVPGTDVSAVHGVFAGWTASDIVAPVGDIAQLAYAIYGDRGPNAIVTPANVSMMTKGDFYGFSTFLLSEFTGQPTDGPHDYGTCWGHLGATYGWNSVVQYMPTLNISISVATNVESNFQAQPSDAFCVAYNRVKQIILNETRSDCVYDASGYFGSCLCPGSKYTCESSPFGSQCVLSYYGNKTFSECSSTCGV
eukprot:m.25333 g.25333  ORF g.25333 m.25333 type:complete len:486 (-) comp14960_c0_seq1:458-1915(-)